MFSVQILLLDSSNLTARVGTLRRENERKNREIEILNRTVRHHYSSLLVTPLSAPAHTHMSYTHNDT